VIKIKNLLLNIPKAVVKKYGGNARMANMTIIYEILVVQIIIIFVVHNVLELKRSHFFRKK
jgi:uncharacterized integral membrane protein